MDHKTQTSDRFLLLLLAIGWLWAICAVASLKVKPQNTSFASFVHPNNKTYSVLNANKPITSVKAAKTVKKRPMMAPSAFTIIRPPLKQANYWPVRPEIDCTQQKCIALTFDDGPSTATPQLLDLLKAKDAKATFFVLGLEIEKYPNVLNRMIVEGHEIGNHTYHHKNLKHLTPPEVSAEINTTQDLIYLLTGYRPHILRPPGGNYNINDPMLADYPIILWSADPWDWKHRNPAIIDSETIPQIQPGSILLLHDIYPTSVEAVPNIIDNLKTQGYSFVTVSELFGWKDESMLPKGQALRNL
jgi:peptidoglycan/xylan/chitin deacetylase (PgdA/CDA1 family)